MDDGEMMEDERRADTGASSRAFPVHGRAHGDRGVTRIRSIIHERYNNSLDLLYFYYSFMSLKGGFIDFFCVKMDSVRA